MPGTVTVAGHVVERPSRALKWLRRAENARHDCRIGIRGGDYLNARDDAILAGHFLAKAIAAPGYVSPAPTTEKP